MRKNLPFDSYEHDLEVDPAAAARVRRQAEGLQTARHERIQTRRQLRSELVQIS